MKKSQKKALEIGAGAVAAAALAAAAGAYLLSGKEGAKRRAKMKTWAKQAQKEVARRAKMARKLSEGEYKRIVDQAVKQYGSLEDVTVREMMNTAKQLKSEWSRIQKHAKMMAKPMLRKAPARRRKAASKKRRI